MLLQLNISSTKTDILFEIVSILQMGHCGNIWTVDSMDLFHWTLNEMYTSGRCLFYCTYNEVFGSCTCIFGYMEVFYFDYIGKSKIKFWRKYPASHFHISFLHFSYFTSWSNSYEKIPLKVRAQRRICEQVLNCIFEALSFLFSLHFAPYLKIIGFNHVDD